MIWGVMVKFLATASGEMASEYFAREDGALFVEELANETIALSRTGLQLSAKCASV